MCISGGGGDGDGVDHISSTFDMTYSDVLPGNPGMDGMQ